MDWLLPLSDFHFLRPWWFALLPVTLILVLLVRSIQESASSWEKAIDPALLDHLLVKGTGTSERSPYILLFLIWLLVIIALAGPTFRKTPQPIHEREDAIVIVLDLTTSMYATDVSPDRLVRAKRKLDDLLRERSEGVTGLIVFAGDAHTVSPLTDDTNTIASMIPALAPEMMPAPGSQVAPALDLAVKLFKDAGVQTGRILLITDEIRDIAAAQSIARNHAASYPVSVMSVGTTEGAPVPIQSDGEVQGYLKDRQGSLVIPTVDPGAMSNFAQLAGGRFTQMTLNDADLEYLLAPDPLLKDELYRELERDFDVWEEEGPWLILLVLPFAAFAFRRGWLWLLAIAILPVDEASADWWDDLWSTRDQQAFEALQSGEAERAASLFEDPAWRASALYRNEAFANAADTFQELTKQQGDTTANYNLGNALAKQGKLEEAIAAYDAALQAEPEHEDAAFNKRLVEELLNQQQQQQQEQSDENQQDSDQDQQDDNSDQNQQQQQDSESEEQQDEQSEGSQSGEEQQEQQEQEQQQSNDEDQQQASEQQAAPEESDLSEEEKQSLQQWLRRVPDDPGGLLRRKFEQQHAERLKNGTVKRESRGNW